MEWREGYLKWQDFRDGRTPDIRKARRYRATDQLINLAQDHDITPDNVTHYFMKDHAKTFPIALKERSKTDDSGKTKGKAMELCWL